MSKKSSIMNEFLNALVIEVAEEEDIEILDDHLTSIVNLGASIINVPIPTGTISIANEISDVAMESNLNNSLQINSRIILEQKDQDFPEHFCMSRDVFEELVDIIQARMPKIKDEIALKKKIMLTIYVLATQNSYRSIGDIFGLSKTKAYAVFKQIVSILAKLLPKFVVWPDEEQLQKIEKEFYALSQNKFLGIVGAIGTCHIKIKRPTTNDDDYFNAQKSYSLILQGTCDHTGKFTDVLIGKPGRCRDSTVFHSSSLYQRLTNPTRPLLPNNKHLLGNSNYPLSLNVLTPFRDDSDLTKKETNYNVIHSSCCNVIQRAFSLLKDKFRRLHYLDTHSMEMANLIIAASCTLHNFILMHEQANIWDNMDLSDDYVVNEGDFDGDSDVVATEKRIELLNLL